MHVGLGLRVKRELDPTLAVQPDGCSKVDRVERNGVFGAVVGDVAEIDTLYPIGTKMDGTWAAPAMYALDQGSLGLQLGSTEIDFVLVVVSQKGVDPILNGNINLGTGAAAPIGRQAPRQSLTATKERQTF